MMDEVLPSLPIVNPPKVLTLLTIIQLASFDPVNLFEAKVPVKSS